MRKESLTISEENVIVYYLALKNDVSDVSARSSALVSDNRVHYYLALRNTINEPKISRKKKKDIEVRLYSTPEEEEAIQLRKFFENLPEELQLRIFTVLPPAQFALLGRVCRSWKQLCEDEWTWKKLCEKHHNFKIRELVGTPHSSWKKEYARLVTVKESIFVLDVKPWDDSTDLDELEHFVRSVDLSHIGVRCGPVERVPLAYGISKLRFRCFAVDQLLDTYELEEKLTSGGYVQSIDIPVGFLSI